MPPLSLSRHLGLDYHVAEARAWLGLGTDGQAFTPLAYAGFELRLAIERILLQYLYSSDPAGLKTEALRLTGKKLERRIYQVAGNQRQVDARIRVVEILFEMLGKPGTLARPRLGDLARDWEYCSGFCPCGMDCTLHYHVRGGATYRIRPPHGNSKLAGCARSATCRDT
jgi:hypothetical protein